MNTWLMTKTWLILAAMLFQVGPGAGATVRGTVVKAGTREGVPGMTVELVGAAGPLTRLPPSANVAVTAANGQFIFQNVPAGNYRIVAAQSGGEYSPAEYGQKNSRGRGVIVGLSAGQRLEGIALEAFSTGAITGKVVDGNSMPVVRARVHAMELVYRQGSVAMNIVQTVHTNDLGEYRLFWLQSGTYYVSARREDPGRRTVTVLQTPPGRAGTKEEIFPPLSKQTATPSGAYTDQVEHLVFYGNTLDASQALPVTVSPGRVAGGIQLSLAGSSSPSFRVRGTVLSAENGQPVPTATVRLIPRTTSADLFVPGGFSQQTGVFEVSGAAAGSYILYVTSPFAAAGQTFGSMPVEITSADLNDLRITLAPSVDLNGSLRVEGKAKVDLTKLRVGVVRDPDTLGMPAPQALAFGPQRGSGPVNGAVASDGSFSLRGLSPGHYRVTIQGLPPEAHIRSLLSGIDNVLKDGLDVRQLPPAPLEILVNTDSASAEGRVLDREGKPIQNATVALVPAAELQGLPLLYKNTATDSAGHFRIEGIRPGQYSLFSWQEVIDGAWMNERFLKNYETRARVLRIAESSNVTDLELSVIQP